MHKKGQVRYVALKLDLEKAYDKLEWSFIQESLEFFQVPLGLIKLIMNMITSTRYRIQWNGVPLLEVRPSRGVPQGDLLSPYIFILCLKHLSRLLEEAIQDRKIHPIRFRGQIRISHIFFADDIFLFTKAKLNDCQNLRRNSTLHQAKLLVPTNLVSGFHLLLLEERKILLQVSLVYQL